MVEAGASGGERISGSASGGGGGYPAAGIGGGGAGGGGGDHATGSGGFSAGGGDSCTPGYNGMGSQDNKRVNSYGTAGGYYTKATGNQYIDVFFGQGGMWQGSDNSDTANWYKDYSGSGGEAGNGGNVYYYNLNKIHAYNGDRITNGDYNQIFYEYSADGIKTSTIAPVLNKLNGNEFVQTKIFAQEGITRAVYSTNQKMSQSDCQKYGVPFVVESDKNKSQTRNVKIKNEGTCGTTGYGQGIGSGSGYIEISNGVFKSINEKIN